MDDEQFQKLVELNKATADSVDKLGEEQKRQSEQLEDVNASLSDFKGQTDVSLARLGTQLEGMKETHKDDRDRVEKRLDKAEKRADDKEAEIEGKVGVAHSKNQTTGEELGKLRGEFDNHVDDNHATVAVQTKDGLANHMVDDNRHSGESPGGAAKTAGIGVVGGGAIWGLIELAKVVFAGS
jgi:chromosome segregation ATPase